MSCIGSGCLSAGRWCRIAQTQTGDGAHALQGGGRMPEKEPRERRRSLYREKSMGRIASIGQLNDYVRVARPSTWLLLIAIILLIAGVIVWSVCGRMESSVPGVVTSENSELCCYVSESESAAVSVGMKAYTDAGSFTITGIDYSPIQIDGSFNSHTAATGGWIDGQWVRKLTLDGRLPAGSYGAHIVVESVAPITYLLN